MIGLESNFPTIKDNNKFIKIPKFQKTSKHAM